MKVDMKVDMPNQKLTIEIITAAVDSTMTSAHEDKRSQRRRRF